MTLLTIPMNKVIHLKDAIRLLESGIPCTIRLWKLANGDILTYSNVVGNGSHWRGGLHRVRFLDSGEIRTVRDVCMFEINNLKIYL